MNPRLALVLLALVALPHAGAAELAAAEGEAWIRCQVRTPATGASCAPDGPGTDVVRLDGSGAARARLVLSWDATSEDAEVLEARVTGADDVPILVVGRSPLVVDLEGAAADGPVSVQLFPCGRLADPGPCPLRALRVVQDQPYRYAWTTISG